MRHRHQDAPRGVRGDSASGHPRARVLRGGGGGRSGGRERLRGGQGGGRPEPDVRDLLLLQAFAGEPLYADGHDRDEPGRGHGRVLSSTFEHRARGTLRPRLRGRRVLRAAGLRTERREPGTGRARRHGRGRRPGTDRSSLRARARGERSRQGHRVGGEAGEGFARPAAGAVFRHQTPGVRAGGTR